MATQESVRSKECRLFLKRARACTLKKGDKVKIFRAARDREAGWTNTWAKRMDKFVGTVVTITSIYDGQVSIKESQCIFPFFVFAEDDQDILKVDEVETVKIRIIDSSEFLRIRRQEEGSK